MRAYELFEKKSEIEVLKANRTTLDDAERDKVIKAGAVWHHGPDGKESPAVWKSKNSSGKIKYVCNTHRAYQAKDTLAAAIKAFDFIESTS